MPCRDDGAAAYEANTLREKLDLATRLLCAVCGNMGETIKNESNELQVWYAAHLQIDAARKEREKKERAHQAKVLKDDIAKSLKRLAELEGSRGKEGTADEFTS